MKHRHPTPQAIRMAIQAAIFAYNDENPDYMFPAPAERIINEAITDCCDAHYKEAEANRCKDR